MTKDGYGTRFLPKDSIAEVLQNFTEGRKVVVAGRMMTCRIMGKAAFAHLKDEFAKIQIYLRANDLGEEGYKAFKSQSMGNILGIRGFLFLSKTGEKTIHVESFETLSTIVKTLPEKWHGLKDTEIRYRQRYVDLIANDEVRETFRKRSQIIRSIRSFLDLQGFMEVETPMMQPIPGGARAKPFVTHHNTLHTDLYLRVAPELYLKRLLVGGFEKVYEINRNFRNEGISVRHNPEFTMLELYQAYADYTDMMEITESMITSIIQGLHGTTVVPFGDKSIDFTRPWKRISFYDSLNEKTGIDFKTANIREAAIKLKMGPIDELKKMEEVDILNEVFGRYVEEELWNPTFVIDYPTSMSPLAKAKDDDPTVVYRFELFCAKMEIANAFSELNDPHDQRRRLESQKEMIGEHKVIDEDFLNALEFAMPPAGGLGIGIDRLVMLATNQHSIREVILFPQLKPEKIAANAEADTTGETESHEV